MELPLARGARREHKMPGMSSGVHQRHHYSGISHMAQGFALVIVGLTSALFLYAGLVHAWPTALWLGVHGMAVGLLALGGWWWWRMPPLTANWLRVSEQFCLAVLLQAYMIVFVFWWRGTPQVSFLVANVLVALAGLAWLLAMLGAIVAETGRILGDRTLLVEGRIVYWLCPVLVLVPLLYALATSVLFYLNVSHASLLDAIRIGAMWPGWTPSVMLFAPVLGLSVAVEAHIRCLRAAALLRKSADAAQKNSS